MQVGSLGRWLAVGVAVCSCEQAPTAELTGFGAVDAEVGGVDFGDAGDSGPADADGGAISSEDAGVVDSGPPRPRCVPSANPEADLWSDRLYFGTVFGDVAISRGEVALLVYAGRTPAMLLLSTNPNEPEVRRVTFPFIADYIESPRLGVREDGRFEGVFVVDTPEGRRLELYRNLGGNEVRETVMPIIPEAHRLLDVAIVNGQPAFYSVPAGFQERQMIRVGTRFQELRAERNVFTGALFPDDGFYGFLSSFALFLQPYDFEELSFRGEVIRVTDCRRRSGFGLVRKDEDLYLVRSCFNDVIVERMDAATGRVNMRKVLTYPTVDSWIRVAIETDAAGNVVVATWPNELAGAVLHMFDPNLNELIPRFNILDQGPEVIEQGTIRLATSPDRPGEVAVLQSGISDDGVGRTPAVAVMRARLCE